MTFRQWRLLVATASNFASSAVLNKFLVAERISLLGPLAYVGGMVLMRLSRRIDPVCLTAGMFLVPMIAVLLGAVFLDERLPLIAFVGMGFILAGSLIVNAFGGGWLGRLVPARAASPG